MLAEVPVVCTVSVAIAKQKTGNVVAVNAGRRMTAVFVLGRHEIPYSYVYVCLAIKYMVSGLYSKVTSQRIYMTMIGM